MADINEEIKALENEVLASLGFEPAKETAEQACEIVRMEKMKQMPTQKLTQKSKLLRVRMTEKEYSILSEIANDCNLTVSDVVRLCINHAISLET